MQDIYNQIKDLYESFEENHEVFVTNGNKAAAGELVKR